MLDYNENNNLITDINDVFKLIKRNQKFSFKNISVDLISNKDTFLKIINRLNEYNAKIDFKPVELIKNNVKILDVYLDEINDIRTGGYDGIGIYDYSLAKGHVLVVEYEDTIVHKIGYLFSYKKNDYGLQTKQLENLARVRFKRLSSEDIYSPLIKATDEIYKEEPIVKDLDIIYQFINTIYRKIQNNVEFKIQYMNLDTDNKIIMLKNFYFQTEELIINNIKENLNNAIEYLDNNQIYAKRKKIYSDIFTELSCGKNRIDLVLDLLDLKIFIDTKFAADYNAIGMITTSIIDNLTSTINFDDPFNISAYNINRKKAIIDIIKKEENINESIKMIQKLFSYDQFINRKIARMIANTIRNNETLEYNNINSAMLKPVYAINKCKCIPDDEKEKYQIFYITNIMSGRIKCESRRLADLIIKSKNKNELKKAFNEK